MASKRTIDTAYEERLQVLQTQITYLDLTDNDTKQSFDGDDDFPDDSVLVTLYIDVEEEFGSSESATSATKDTAEGPFAITPGHLVALDVDDVGSANVVFDAAQGRQDCSTYFPVADLVGKFIEVSVDGGEAQTVEFETPCTTSAHVRAQIAAQTTGCAVSSATTAKAAYVPTNTSDAPYNLTHGLTVKIDVDDAGVNTATFVAARAVAAGSGLAIVNISGETLTLKINGGALQTITFGAGDVSADTACATINSQLLGGWAEVVTGEIKIYSDTLGTGGIVEIVGGSARAELGLTIAVNVEATSKAVDCTAVTIAEIKTWLEAAITGSSGITVTNIGGNRFSITSDTTGVDSEIDIQASTALTELGLTVSTVIGTADQPRLTSDVYGTDSSIAVTDVDSGLTWLSAVAGTGDVADSTNITAQEVADRFEADTTAVCTVEGDVVTISSPTAGVDSELDFKSGTALTALGLSVEKINGNDPVTGTATMDVGIKSADTDAIIDGADISSASGNINGPKGIAPSGNYSGKTPYITIDTAGANCNQFTEGSATVTLVYSVISRALND
jgi:hypothetical protein